MEVTELTVVGSIEGLKTKKFSATELVDSYKKRIEEADPKIKAFLTMTFEGAHEKAEEADKRISRLDDDAFKEQPLLGVPVAHKDLYLTAGVKTTAGSRVLENYIPQYSATVVKRLEKAGAILIGKTNLDAWGHGSSGENSDFFPTRNPWNLKYVPGGSSSGSAAAVASGMVPIATGTDTGGSTRLPASFCGVVGIKPTYGRVSRYGVVAMASSLDTMGHMARTVEDCALVLSVTAGRDPYDATSLEVGEVGEIREFGRIKGIKVGLPREYFVEGLAREVDVAVKNAAKKFEQLGAEVLEVSLPHTQYAIAVYYVVQTSEVSSNLARYDGVRFGNDRNYFGAEARRRIMLGTHALSSGYIEQYYNQAKRVQSLIRQDFDKVFKKVDVLLSPVSPTPPFRLGEKTDDPLEMYLSDVLTVSANLAGLPALALPCGFTGDKLPIGMQLIGPHLSESTLFKAGFAYQQATDWHKKRPND